MSTNPEPVLAQERTVQLHVAQEADEAEVQRLTALFDTLLGDAVAEMTTHIRRAATVDLDVSLAD